MQVDFPYSVMFWVSCAIMYVYSYTVWVCAVISGKYSIFISLYAQLKNLGLIQTLDLIFSWLNSLSTLSPNQAFLFMASCRYMRGKVPSCVRFNISIRWTDDIWNFSWLYLVEDIVYKCPCNGGDHMINPWHHLLL